SIRHTEWHHGVLIMAVSCPESGLRHIFSFHSDLMVS
ncbi:hypothetical protein A2U01_0089999, partial [Trifolium medium]|nr:hypothetical protein [Trifolium medium]